MKILLPLDDSTYAGYALEMLCCLPIREQVDLSLLTVIASLPNADLEALERRAVETFLEQRSRVLARQFRSATAHTSCGSPGFEITQFAAVEEIDLVVLGAIGRSALLRVLLGSVSEYVAVRAGCSVLVVRPPTGISASRFLKAAMPGNLLIAIGNTNCDRRMSQWIREMKIPIETEIHLLHVIERRTYYERDLLRKASAHRKEVRSLAKRHLETIQSELQSAGFVVYTKICDAPHIGQALVEYAAERECELILTGDHRESLIERALLGCTSRYVLRHAPCSVLIAR
ncbi:universal stress protein UspE [Stieleria maiorica]|uniref:Universal stress protein UspE n=1 Tax=Stieleria maiorica TaxID=2795974 RepID=A0A5B9M9Q9_9BACT|nr:universal stress protein [Stieleria maiorica]QEF97848.1 universal stress protein UspE [Stieleria maiorica]